MNDLYRCIYQVNVECPQRLCAKCGWNPEVGQARLEAIIAKLNEEEEGGDSE